MSPRRLALSLEERAKNRLDYRLSVNRDTSIYFSDQRMIVLCSATADRATNETFRELAFMNRFKFRLSLIDLLRGIAVQDTAAARLRLAASWTKEFYLPGFEAECRDAETYAAELAAFNHCFGTSEQLALQQFNRVISARANGSALNWQIIAEAAARALEAFQIRPSAPEQAQNSGLPPSWALFRVHDTVTEWRGHTASRY